MQLPRLHARTAFYLAPLLLVVLSAPAFGHAALTGSTPKDGARLDEVPATVEVNYAEPPTTDTKLSVTDGCDRDVARNVEVLNQSVTADVGSGQPGDWKVEWAVVSAVDGHLTRDSVRFKVAGEPDCEQAAADETPTDEESGTTFPIVPVVVATVLILAVALVVRSRST